jgi:hypothetical protein
MNQVESFTLYFVYLFIAKFVLVYVYSLGASIAAIRTTKALRLDFLQSLLRQDISFFDSSEGGSPSVKVTTNGYDMLDGEPMIVEVMLTSFVQQQHQQRHQRQASAAHPKCIHDGRCFHCRSRRPVEARIDLFFHPTDHRCHYGAQRNDRHQARSQNHEYLLRGWTPRRRDILQYCNRSFLLAGSVNVQEVRYSFGRSRAAWDEEIPQLRRHVLDNLLLRLFRVQPCILSRLQDVCVRRDCPTWDDYNVSQCHPSYQVLVSLYTASTTLLYLYSTSA